MDYDGRSVSGECCLYDIDPEMIRKSVRKLMQQIGQIEREKDEYKMQQQATKKELEDATNQQVRYEHKMAKLQHTLRAVNEEKANLDTKLNQKQMTLQSVEEALKVKTDDLNALTDKYKSLDLQYSSLSEHKMQTEVCFQLTHSYARVLLTRSTEIQVVDKSLIKLSHSLYSGSLGEIQKE